GIPRERIVFEVVESDDVEDRDHLLNILRYYRKEGFRVALDDLGSGYSSLNLLTEILPDVAKLDMALIRDIDTDPVRQKVVTHLLHLARELGVTTVVEGVETAAEADFCRSAGADLVQGYFFARPAHHPWRAEQARAA
ncbi:EAL domain-containing protein, partial [bacterium]